LDPARIRPSRWANRHEASFATVEFDEFKAEIRAAGRNVQPIKVRPVSGAHHSSDETSEGFELIFGHTRHRACLELGIPVLAIIEQATDVSLFEQMERENRGRKNLSAWEQGNMYRKALDEGLYPSLRRLAESLNVDVSLVSKGVALARLPDEVVAAFQSPLDIQFRWATPLADAVKKNPDLILKTAKVIASNRGRMVPAAIFSKLIGEQIGVLNGSTAKELEIKKEGKRAAALSSDTKGRAVIRFEPGALPDERRAELVSLIENFLKT
jgi:ParB family chromosome partitioning protein